MLFLVVSLRLECQGVQNLWREVIYCHRIN